MNFEKNIVLFVPFYNEARRDGIYEYLVSLSRLQGVKLVLVDDGSTDSTLDILNQFCSPNIEIISNVKNSGKGEALRKAMLEFISNNKHERIGFLDCDGAFPIDTVRSNLEKSTDKLSGEIQVFIASRIMLAGRKVERKRHRHYISRIIITLIGLKYSFMPYDSQSGFKLFRVSNQLKLSLQEPFKTKWLFDVELLDRITSQFESNVIWEEPVQEWYDKPGSHLKLKSIFSVFKDLSTLLFSKRGL